MDSWLRINAFQRCSSFLEIIRHAKSQLIRWGCYVMREGVFFLVNSTDILDEESFNPSQNNVVS